MTANIIDGTEIARKIRERIKKEVSAMKKKPGLAAIIVGDNAASSVYVGIKRKQCEEAGIYSEEHKLPEKTTQEELLSLIEELNSDDKINAILVQLPLPKHISTEKVLSSIALEKDVDGFNPANIGKLADGNETAVPCTPKGIIRLLEETGIEIEGK